MLMNLVKVINMKLLTPINKDIFIPKYNQLLIVGYSDTVFLIRQMTKQHQQFNHAQNHIKDHPNIANDTLLSTQREDFVSNLLFPFW